MMNKLSRNVAAIILVFALVVCALPPFAVSAVSTQNVNVSTAEEFNRAWNGGNNPPSIITLTQDITLTEMGRSDLARTLTIMGNHTIYVTGNGLGVGRSSRGEVTHGHLILDGSIISVPAEGRAGRIAVMIRTNGSSFTMISGGISAAYWSTSPYNVTGHMGVEIRGGNSSFIMQGGFISGGTSGVSIVNGTFIMEDGTLSGNSTGVMVLNDSNFVMMGGTISGNSRDGVNMLGTNSTFTMEGGTISDNDRGVLLQGGSVFKMSSGTITENNTGINHINHRGEINLQGGRIHDNTVDFNPVQPSTQLPPQQVLDTPPVAPQDPPAVPNNHSSWAGPELRRAAEQNLIPATLQPAYVDLTQPITRAEFAGIVVLTFENLAHTMALSTIANPFTDTHDPYVLRAFNTGLMVGVSDTQFDPNTPLNREQTATALTRAFKRATIPTWTFATDANYPLNFTWPALFADDANISDWARESVYFMAANGIILGTGNNMFSPRAATTEQQARGYAVATREQALIIALRMVENLR